MPIALKGAVRFSFLAASVLIPRSYASDAEALAITANIQARHLPFQTVMDPVFASSTSDQIVGYTRCGDSALWTGHYLAAESFRYSVTHAQDALANMKNSIAGIKALVDVTGNNFLARCLVVANSPYAAGIQSEEAQNGIYTNGPYIWVGNTSRDQYAGAVFGLAAAYDLVDDAGVKSSISDLITRLIEYPRGHNWTTSNGGFLIRPDYISTFLEVARHINPSRFNGNTFEENFILTTIPIATPIQIETNDDNSYFKFNLDYINFYNLIRLDPNTGNTSSRNAYSVLRNHTVSHLNAFFDIIDRSVNGANAARDAETVSLLNQWLQRGRRDQFVELSNTVPVCGSQACQPVPVPLRPPTDFLWQRSPFQLFGGLYGTIEGAGIDYILPYWMARYYGVITGLSVQSAAASKSPVAPSSLASIFGPNPATATVSAGLPLPTTLGGLTLTVQDANGTQRMAQLLYVSATQVNFIVPDGTANGNATFTVSNGSTNAAATTGVASVAPALFSMNGNGSGVAAATAVRVQVSNPALQSPVTVFQCASTCSSVPIDLGIDTPVYVTLYGTGIRYRTSLANVSVTVNGLSVPVQYAGPQPSFAGLDQVNVVLPLSLRGSGEVNVALTVDGQASNAVTLNIK